MELFAIVTTFCITLILPLFAFVLLPKFFKGGGKPIIFGVLTFVFFQMILRIPLLTVLGNKVPSFSLWCSEHLVYYALFLGVTAALFEEVGRFLVMKYFLKNRRSVTNGILFGIGHGGIECVLLVGISYLTILIYGMRGFATSGEILIAALERISTVSLHIGWSVMVMRTIITKKPGGLFLAIFLHTVIDALVVYLYTIKMNVYLLEAGLFILGIGSALYVVSTFRKEKEENIQKMEEEKDPSHIRLTLEDMK